MKWFEHTQKLLIKFNNELKSKHLDEVLVTKTL
jgi:hypothetical protein